MSCPGETLAVDQVFHITLADGREALLHIEFQGRSSRAPMRWRVLEYMVRLAVNYRLRLLSVVIYVGWCAVKAACRNVTRPRVCRYPMSLWS